MRFLPQSIRIQNREITFRSAKMEDGAQLIDYLKTTAAETPYLAREPEEITITLDQEENFLKAKELDERELMLVAFDGERHIGNCSVSRIGSHKRYSHRCSIAIALYKEYCGMGIGRKMLELVLGAAKDMGYEQAELEVVSDNVRALSLYESLGFVRYGTLPDSMRYKDGSYADCYWMMKKL